jgi:hypothetical protein
MGIPNKHIFRSYELNEYWDEYRYRHEHVWSNTYKLTFAVSLISILPYLHREVVCVVAQWAVWLPALAAVLALFGLVRGYRELKVLDSIKKKHRLSQKTLIELGTGWFRVHMLAYLISLFAASLVNFYVISAIWVPTVSQENPDNCFSYQSRDS